MARKYILLCDDDEGIADVVTIILRARGYEVDTVASGKELLRKITLKRPNVLLLDLWMPGISGDQVAAELKNNPETSAIPIIIISASKDTVLTAQQTGVDAYLHKPFDIVDLEAMVDKFALRSDVS